MTMVKGYVRAGNRNVRLFCSLLVFVSAAAVAVEVDGGAAGGGHDEGILSPLTPSRAQLLVGNGGGADADATTASLVQVDTAPRPHTGFSNPALRGEAMEVKASTLSGSESDENDEIERHHKGKLTIIIMNWARPQVLALEILPRLAAFAIVDRIIVSHGQRSTAFETPGLGSKVKHLRAYEDSDDMELGLFRRFKAAEAADTECVVWMDDDMLPKQRALLDLYKHWLRTPSVIHGMNGRNLFEADGYPGIYDYNAGLEAEFREVGREGKAKDDAGGEGTTIGMMLTQLIVAKRQHAIDVLPFARDPKVSAFAHKEARPVWNGEDIFFSFATAFLNSRSGETDLARIWPRAHPKIKMLVRELDSGEKGSGISTQPLYDHYRFRVVCANKFARFFEAKGLSTRPVARVAKQTQMSKTWDEMKDSDLKKGL